MFRLRTRIAMVVAVCLGLFMSRVELENLWREDAEVHRVWEEERMKNKEYERYYLNFKLGDLIPARPYQFEGDHPLCVVDRSKFYVYVQAPNLPLFCAFDECGSGGGMVEQLGGFLLGDGEHEAHVPVTDRGSYVLVANEQARIVGIYPHCTVADLPIILPLHPETGAVAAPVPKRLAWNARCRPDLTVAPLSAAELWREAMRTKLHLSIKDQIH